MYYICIQKKGIILNVSYMYTIIVMDHRVLDPPRRAHQVLDTPVHQRLVRCREDAVFVLLHRCLPACTCIHVARFLGGVVWIILTWGLVLVMRPHGHSGPCEQLEGQLFEEVFDDVHHIGADVPDYVE
jgi:hypothetical protein